MRSLCRDDRKVRPMITLRIDTAFGLYVLLAAYFGQEVTVQ